MAKIVNALTGVETEDIVGTKAELKYFRVMPMGGEHKLFFDGPEQYKEYQKNALTKRTEV